MTSRPSRIVLAIIGWVLLAGGCERGQGSGAERDAGDAAGRTGVGSYRSQAERAAQIADGRAIVESQCSGCHAPGATGTSPRSDAPALRHVLADYAPDALAQDFREGIHVGHRDMPDFDFGLRETDAVLAYLVSIQVPPGAE